MNPNGLNYSKKKKNMLVKMEVDLKAYHNAIEVGLIIMKKKDADARWWIIVSWAWYCRGETSIKLLISSSYRERAHSHKKDRGGGECSANSMY